MNELTIEWQEAGQRKIQKIYDQQPSKNPGAVRIGRDPIHCDILLTNPTVSGLHVEIFFHPQQQRFYLKNLRQTNPPVVDGRQLIQGEVALNQGSTIYLGQMEIKVIAISIPQLRGIPETIVSPPPPGGAQQFNHQVAHNQALHNQAGHNQALHNIAAHRGAYGLMCPKCHRVSPAEQLECGCRWCGTSLAAAVSALLVVEPSKN